MKAPKYIEKLAIEQVKADSKVYGFIKEGDKDWIYSNIKELMDVKTALEKGRIYLGVESVSKSGISRVIVIKYIKDNKLRGVTDMVYKLAGCDKKHRIQGCGMDMLYQAQYNLWHALCPTKNYWKMPRYNDLF